MVEDLSAESNPEANFPSSVDCHFTSHLGSGDGVLSNFLNGWSEHCSRFDAVGWVAVLEEEDR